LLPLDFSETKSLCTIGSKTASVKDASRASDSSSSGKRKLSIDDAECINVYANSENLFCSDRTGRWTSEEVAYVNALTDAFDCGMFLLVNGTRLHDFLTNFLKCKLSRLTKKFKKANFTRCYVYRRGIHNIDQNVRIRAIRMRVAETYTSFLSSIGNEFLKAQMRLLTSAQWKKYLVEFCSEQLSVHVDHFIGAEEYCSSIQELDRLMEYHSDELKKRRKLDVTAHRAISVEDIPSLDIKKAGRTKKKVKVVPEVIEKLKTVKDTDQTIIEDEVNNKLGKIVMKQAPREQENNQKLSIRTAATAASEPIDEDFLLLWGIREEEDPIVTDDEFQSHSDSDSSSQQVHPFLSKLEEYFAKNILPFDYVEVWLPIHDQGKVSLCCGGGFVPEKNKASPELLHFASISSQTVFDAGVGLPGRTYSSGQSHWEQGIQYAQAAHFPRVEAAGRAGIQTAVGIPVSCEVVGSLIVCFFSTTYVIKDDALVSRIWQDLNALNSVSQWALDSNGGNNFDLLESSPEIFKPITEEEAAVHGDELAIDKSLNPRETAKQGLLKLLTEQIPLTSSASSQEEVNMLQGFMILRMLLLRNEHSLNAKENEITQVMCASYSLYAKMKKWTHRELAHMIVREFIYLNPDISARSMHISNKAQTAVNLGVPSFATTSTVQPLPPLMTFLHGPPMASSG
jgi:ribosomal protein L31E